ncbi:hypothetical protein V5O48_008111 [Marasmius crinis-equi]|uniref:Rhodopsin domain-containing protein n=1 Tax=Marasmius crinis-equi TaxID=585013 RepID=A0ABR3FEU2_9AGAR
MDKQTGGPANPFDTLSGRVVITVFHSFAILLTLYRLFHRVRIHRFSWDDWLAFLALLLMGFYAGSDWMRLKLVHSNDTNDPSEHARLLIILLTVNMSLSTAIIWCCRSSLALSIMRILPPGRRRIMSLVLAFTFFLVGSLLIIFGRTTCSASRGGEPRMLKCDGGKALYIATAISDIISSILLVALPLHCLWRASNLAQNERRLIMILFTSTVLTLVACLVNAVYIAKRDAFGITYSAKLEASISLTVCNLVVVVTSLYRTFIRNHDEADLEASSSRSPATPHPSITNEMRVRPELDTTSYKSNSDLFELTRISDIYSLYPDLDLNEHTTHTEGTATHVHDCTSSDSSPKG